MQVAKILNYFSNEVFNYLNKLFPKTPPATFPNTCTIAEW